MACLSIRLFGPFQAAIGDDPVTGFRSDKVRALLAYLTVENERPHRREKLAGLLWPNQPERSARANLRRALANLRQMIGDHQAKPSFLRISRQALQFNKASDAWVDVNAFVDLLSPGERSPQTIPLLEEAVKLYRGSFLEGFSVGDSAPFEEWMLLSRERLHRLIMGALRDLAERHEEREEYERALRYAWRQVDLDPWREKAHRHLMRLLALNGQRGAALSQYETCSRLLVEGLGVQPAAETRRLYERIRDGELRASEDYPLDVSAKPPPFLSEEAPANVKRPLFVGRERELRRMGEFLEMALEGEGRVVFVTGDAGRGKTSLLDEFACRSLATYPDLLVAAGNCNTYSGVGDPYLPFRYVLAMLTGDLKAKWAAGAITRDHACRLWGAMPSVAQLLVERGPELVGIFLAGKELVKRAALAVPEGTGWLEQLQELAGRAQVGPSGLERTQLFEQYANVLRGLAARRPLLILLDDLQWADDASISLLFHLGRCIDSSRILIACAYRPDEVALGQDGGRHPLEKALSEFKRYSGDVWVDLEETEEAEARRFVYALLSAEPNQLSEEFRRELFLRTRGHPLFTVELIRAMRDRGNLVRDEKGRWVEGSRVDWEELPVRVEGVLGERIGRLDPALRELLAVASVEGEEFTAQVLASVQNIDERQVLRALSQELEKRHHLVRERGEARAGRRHLSRYQFTHVLFQQYLYNSLGAGERRLLHREVASALEELYEEHAEGVAAVAPQLAHHYAGDPERERFYAKLAGERAAARFANAEALRHLSRALALTPQEDLAGRYEILLTRERVFNLQGEREEQRRDLAALEDIAQALDEAAPPPAGGMRRSEAALRRARYAGATGDYPASAEAAQEAIRLAQMAQDMGMEAAGYLWLGRALCYQADYEAAGAQLERALVLARKSGARRTEADCLHNLSLVFWLQGDHAEAKGYSERALCIYREIGDRRNEGIVLNTFGLTSSEQGDHSRAKEYFEQTLCIAREIGDRRGEGRALGNIGLCYAEGGNYAEARGYFEQSLQIRNEIGDKEGACGTLSNLGLLSHDLGDCDTAWEYSQQALCLAKDIGIRRWQGYALTNLGRVLESLERPTEAAESYRQALALRRELGQRQLAMDILAGLARLSLFQEEPPQAQTYVEEILSYLEGNPPDGIEEPFRVYLTCYRVLRANEDPRAGDILSTAHRLLQERAAKISDEKMRQSFLENVTAHREIASEWRGTSGG